MTVPSTAELSASRLRNLTNTPVRGAVSGSSSADGKALYGAGAAMNAGNGNVMLTGVNIALRSSRDGFTMESERGI